MKGIEEILGMVRVPIEVVLENQVLVEVQSINVK